MIKVSAPGKLVIFGEHAVVYNRPCIVTAVNHRMSVSLDKRKDDKIVINAPEVDVKNYTFTINELKKDHPRQVAFVTSAIRNFFEKYKVKSGLDVSTKSEFSSKFGFGSSSAVTVCTLKALSEVFKIKMSNKELFDISYKAVLDVQKVGSGFDIASSIYGGTIYFVTGGKAIKPLSKNIPLVIGYTGIKADTVTLINMVKGKMNENKEEIEEIFDKMKEISDKAVEFVEKEDLIALGKLMNENQKLLSKLGVSTKELDNLISASLKAGVYGAKLSGAGGGDCMIALTNQKEKAEKAIQKAGGIIIPVETGVEGVRIE